MPEGFVPDKPAASAVPEGFVPDAPGGGAMNFAIVNGQRVPIEDPGVIRGVVDTLNPLPMAASLGAAYKQAVIDAGKSGQPPLDPLQFTLETVAKGIASAQLDQAKKVHLIDAIRRGDVGDVVTSLGHAAAAALPIVGPMAAKAGEDIVSGKPRYGVGEALGTLAPFAAKYGTEVARTGAFAPTTEQVAAAPPLAVRVGGVAPNANPVEREAVAFGQERGIPVDAGTASGNPVVRGAQYLADRSLGGARIASRATQAQADALTRVGGELANEVHPTPVTPEQAGADVRGSLQTLVGQLHEQANTAYDRLRELEAEPWSAAEVPTLSTQAVDPALRRTMARSLGGPAPSDLELNELRRIRAEMQALPYQRGGLGISAESDAAGEVAKSAYTPRVGGASVYHDILQHAPGTSDMSRAAVIQSLDDALNTGRFTNAARGALNVAKLRLAGSSRVGSGQLPPDAGLADAGMASVQAPVDLAVVKQFVRPLVEQMRRQLPITQQQANPGLHAMQNLLDGPDAAPLSQVDRDLSAIKSIARAHGGLARSVVHRLDAAVREAAARLGPEATQALAEGRSATVAKYGTQAVLESLREEPVQTFNQLTYAKDAGIDRLRAVAEHAPMEMQKIGRAYLEDLLTQAGAEGGFTKARTLATKWANLGPETKRILFADPGLVQQLDRFFLLAKKSAENPNPSGSGFIGSLGAQGAYLVLDPMRGIPTEIGAAVLAKALRSPRVVRLLTQGFTMPVTNKVGGSMLAAQMLRAVREVAPMAAQGPASTPPDTARR